MMQGHHGKFQTHPGEKSSVGPTRQGFQSGSEVMRLDCNAVRLVGLAPDCKLCRLWDGRLATFCASICAEPTSAACLYVLILLEHGLTPPESRACFDQVAD